MQPRIRPFGEAALLVEFGEEPDLGLNARVHALARSLEAAPPPGLLSLIPGYVSLLVEFEPPRAELEILKPVLRDRVSPDRRSACSRRTAARHPNSLRR